MLTAEELLNVSAGAVSWGFITAITGLVVFLIGVVDGYLRHLKCR